MKQLGASLKQESSVIKKKKNRSQKEQKGRKKREERKKKEKTTEIGAEQRDQEVASDLSFPFLERRLVILEGGSEDQFMHISVGF